MELGAGDPRSKGDARGTLYLPYDFILRRVSLWVLGGDGAVGPPQHWLEEGVEKFKSSVLFIFEVAFCLPYAHVSFPIGFEFVFLQDLVFPPK